MEPKYVSIQIQKSDNPNYDARFVMSASSPDRVNDTIDPRAYKSNLGKRLICLWQHKSDQPIGYWDNLRVKSGQLIGDLKVAATNLGQMVRQLITEDVPLGASIGFHGKGDYKDDGGIHFTELELLECSVVSVPCHPEAQRIAKSFGIDIESKGVDLPSADSGAGAAQERAAKAVIAAKRILKGIE